MLQKPFEPLAHLLMGKIFAALQRFLAASHHISKVVRSKICHISPVPHPCGFFLPQGWDNPIFFTPTKRPKHSPPHP